MEAIAERPTQMLQTRQSFVDIYEMLRRVEEHRKLDVETRLKMLASLPPLDEEILCFDDTRALARDREARIMALLDM